MRIEKDAIKNFIYRVKKENHEIFTEMISLNQKLDTRNYFPFVDYSGNMGELLKSRDFPNGLLFHSVQNAADSPNKGNVAFVLTFRINQYWGDQWLFVTNGTIYYRTNFNGTVGTWNKKVS